MLLLEGSWTKEILLLFKDPQLPPLQRSPAYCSKAATAAAAAAAAALQLRHLNWRRHAAAERPPLTCEVCPRVMEYRRRESCWLIERRRTIVANRVRLSVVRAARFPCVKHVEHGVSTIGTVRPVDSSRRPMIGLYLHLDSNARVSRWLASAPGLNAVRTNRRCIPREGVSCCVPLC